MLIEYNPQFETPRKEAPLGLGTFLTLQPGKGDYSPQDWKKALENPAIAKQINLRLDKRIIVVLNELSETENLRDLSVVKAADIVKDTFDPKLLKTWRDNDTRKGILAAIDEQLEAIEKAATAGIEGGTGE